MVKEEPFKYHRFLDEAGDTTFYGKGKLPIIGSNGVSSCFILGMLKVKEPLDEARQKVLDLQMQIAADPYFEGVPSIEKKKDRGSYFLHAKDDLPEVRKMGFELLKNINCSFEAVMGRKIYSLYERKHNGREAEFYADLLSHLLKNKFKKYDRLVLNMARRSKCTTQNNLNLGLSKATDRFAKRYNPDDNCCKVVFNVQEPTNEPLLNVADYFCWAIQRVFEKGETRFYDFVGDQIAMINDLYDFDNFEKGRNIYNRKRRLEKANKLI